MFPVFTDDHQECQGPLLEYCRAIFPVKQNRFLAYLSCFTAMFRGRPLSVSFFYSLKLSKVLQMLSYDVIVADCSTMAQYVMGVPAPKVLDFVDIDSQKWRLFSTMTRFPFSLVYKIESSRLAQFEQMLSKQFDYCLVTSPYEKSLLENVPNIVVLPNGVDQHYFSPQNAPVEGTIIFTGVMNYFPNSDAVLYFHRHIFPLIKRDIPAAQFIISGMHPTVQIRKLVDPNTVVTGFVPDIREHLSRASVCVVPLRLAMGVQNKILEAMAMGVPVVATSVANRGINATPGKEILVADDPESFATATKTLLKDPDLRETITKNAQQFIEQNFRWEKNLNKLDALISEIIAQPNIPRDFSAR
jgi:sugar transferase (PEP-CTERM/EpsH1 system associated)